MHDPLEWPRWWRGCRSVRELAPGGAERIGARFECEWRGPAPVPIRFEFEVEEVVEPERMRGRATGAVSGIGTWRLFEAHDVTAVTYEWDVKLARAWMGALPTVVLRASHDRVMRDGREGLAHRLGCG